MILRRIFLFPPRLIFTANLRVNFSQHGNAPPAPRPRRQTFRNLRRRFRLLPPAKILHFPQRNVEAEAKSIVRFKRHDPIIPFPRHSSRGGAGAMATAQPRMHGVTNVKNTTRRTAPVHPLTRSEESRAVPLACVRRSAETWMRQVTAPIHTATSAIALR